MKYPTLSLSLFRNMGINHRKNTSTSSSLIFSWLKTIWNLNFMSPCTSVELCCICGIRVDLIPTVLTASMLDRSWSHIVLDALLRWLAAVRGGGSQTYRQLPVTEGLHFQTILRIRCYHWNHRKGATAESAIRFGETPIVVPTISTGNALHWVSLRYCCVHSTTLVRKEVKGKRKVLKVPYSSNHMLSNIKPCQ